MKKPEILAPAGDYKSFIAAVEAGADAVYFGGKDFSARASATNLSREEIQKALDYAHLRGVKCYAAANTLIKDDEFEKFFDYVNFLYEEGVDALIIQDLGVLSFCRKYWPDLALHASTQMAAHNLNDVLALGKMGFKRVVLARELTIGEIKEIKESVSTVDSLKRREIELEVFVHGALCFSYSGRCLMSSMIGGRSGNRGRCAQPCRKKYILCDYASGEKLGAEGYLLSTKDLCAIDILDKLRFVDSLKIEGRMKSAEYVGLVAEKYRKHVDALAKRTKPDWREDKKEMAAIFNRGGFSHGYLLEKKPGDLISPERSKNFGVKVGEVIYANKGRIGIRAEDAAVNDGLEIWGRGGQEKNFGFRVEKISDGTIETLSGEDIRKGDAVYKTFDYNLNKKLSARWKENNLRNVPVKLVFEAEEGAPVKLKINDIEIEGEKAEIAEKSATSEETVKEQLMKFGNTPFFAKEIKASIKGKLNIPLKNINELRRRGAAKLAEKIIGSFKRRGKKYEPEIFAKRKICAKNICVQSDDPAVLEALLEKKGLRRIYTSLEIDAEKFHKAGIEVFRVLPPIWRRGEKLEIQKDCNGFLVPSIGYLEKLPLKSKKIADYFLGVFNNYSARQIKDMGFSGFTSSAENTLEEINAITGSGLEKEVIVYGHLPLVIAEHCVFSGTKHCRGKNPGIKDEAGAIFPVMTDCVNCRMKILNSSALYFTDMEKLVADNIRLAHTIECPEKFLAIIDDYLSGNFRNKKIPPQGISTAGWNKIVIYQSRPILSGNTSLGSKAGAETHKNLTWSQSPFGRTACNVLGSIIILSPGLKSKSVPPMFISPLPSVQM